MSIPSSHSSRHPVRKLDLQKLQTQQETLQSRLLDLKDSLTEKDMVLKSQRNTIKMYEHKLTSLQQNNTTLRHIISVLSKHITEELNEALPAVPTIPEEEEQLRMDPVSLLNPKSPPQKLKQQKQAGNRSFHSDASPGPPMSSFSTAFRQNKGYVRATKSKPIAFDPALSQNLFEDFSGADFMKAILDAQLTREDFQKTVKFLLGNVSKEVLMFQTKTILFETLSFFLSSRNVAFQNASDVFLPRVLEMLVDVLEVERVVLFMLDSQAETFYSRAVTADLPEQLVINRDFGHLGIVYGSQAALTIQNAYEDPKFDATYDQMCATITQNLCCVPIRLGEQFIGILECSNKRRPFVPTDLVIMTQVSKQLAIGLTGATAKERLQDLALKGTGNRGSIDSAKDALLLPLLQTVVTGVQAQISCERATVFIHDSNQKELFSIYGTSLDGVIRIPLTRGLASLSFTTKTIINVPRAEEHPMFNSDLDKRTGFATREVLAIPIGSRGVLECINKKNFTAFSKSDETRAGAMAVVLNTLLDAGDSLEGVLLNADFNELCMQAVKVAVVHVNTRGLLQKVNQYAAEVFQLNPERMVGMTLSELLHDSPDLLLDFQSATRQATLATFKNRRLAITRESKQRAELTVNVTILPLLGLAEGPAFVLMLHPQLK